MLAHGVGDSVYGVTKLSPAPRVLVFLIQVSWGSAALHPRLYAFVCSADWSKGLSETFTEFVLLPLFGLTSFRLLHIVHTG